LQLPRGKNNNFIIPQALARDEEAYMAPAAIMRQHYLMFNKMYL
jgi:hypothetical protein